MCFKKVITTATQRELLALGHLSSVLASRYEAWNEGAPDWFPEPLEWMQLWEEALQATRLLREET